MNDLNQLPKSHKTTTQTVVLLQHLIAVDPINSGGVALAAQTLPNFESANDLTSFIEVTLDPTSKFNYMNYTTHTVID